MNKIDYAITFACYNQVEYTRKCVDSMIKYGVDLNRLVVVDNGSTDETRSYLETLPLGGCIFNKANLGCGVAWNQGALALVDAVAMGGTAPVLQGLVRVLNYLKIRVLCSQVVE